MHYCLADARINSGTNCSRSREKMVKIGSVVFELKWVENGNCAATWPKLDEIRSFGILSLSKWHIWCILAPLILARSAKLPKGLYILPSVISRRQIILRSARPIFVIFTSNERFLAVDDRSGPLFSISHGTLPWQPILCKKWKTPHFRRSGIQKRYEVTPCMDRIK